MTVLIGPIEYPVDQGQTNDTHFAQSVPSTTMTNLENLNQPILKAIISAYSLTVTKVMLKSMPNDQQESDIQGR
jgi:hypothetical protein